MTLPAGLVVRPDDGKSSVLARGARVGLHRARVEASDLAEVRLQFLQDAISMTPSSRATEQTYLDHLEVSLDLVSRRERMNVRELGPGERDHTARAVEFHSAAPEGDHCVDEPEVLRLEVVDVPEHLSLRVMRVEDGVREKRRRALKRLGDSRGRRGSRDDALGSGRSEDLDQDVHVPLRDALVEGDTDVLVVYSAQVNLRLHGRCVYGLHVARGNANIES